MTGRPGANPVQGAARPGSPPAPGATADRPAGPLAALLLIAAALASPWGCGPGEPAGEGKPPAAPDDALTRTTEEGPVKATVTLTPAKPRLGDRLTLRLEVEAQPGVLVEMPAFGEALGRFAIVDFTPRQETGADGRTIASQSYTLQAPMSGKQRIPPLRVEFLDQRDPQQGVDAGSDEYRELLTEDLSIEVASVLPDGPLADELRPARPALDELPAGGLARTGAWALAVLAAIVAACFWYVRWRRRAAERARVTAYDRAVRRIRALEARGFPSASEADAWYVELSDIVRRYLEDRYGVRAPELTTEEFLQEARRSAELSEPHRGLLSSFLERCDRVKFAAYHPDEPESRSALEAAGRFLDETRAVEEPPPGTAAEKTAA